MDLALLDSDSFEFIVMLDRRVGISSTGGIVMPRAIAVFRLITNSSLEGCSIGRSAVLAPLSMRSTK
jgi:hypothetical protein